MVVIKINDEDAYAALLASTTQIIVTNFTATWNGPSLMINPVFEEFSNQAAFSHMVFVLVDVDESHDIATHNNIRTNPTFIVYQGKGGYGDGK